MSKKEVQRKIYLFKAAPEELSDTLFSVHTTTNSLLPQLQQPKEQQETKNDTTNLRDHGQRRGIEKDDNSTPPEGGVTTTTTNDVTIKDRFITHLNSLQIENQLVPVMVFEYSKLDSVWRHLKDPTQHAGIIFTSPRCVYSCIEAIKLHDNLLDWGKSLRTAWESKYVFCVGPSTVSTARLLLPSLKPNLLLTGVESHAESLANKIIEVNCMEAFNSPLLYPCGMQRRDVLLKKLEQERIACSQHVVYESVKNPSLEVILNAVSKEIKSYQDYEEKETVLCFFSPSGIKYVFQHLDSNIIVHSRTNVVVIGPTSRDAIGECFKLKGINKRVFQCKDPTPEALLDIIVEINKSL